MTDRAKKISELNAHTNASGDDLLVIVDQPGLANAETKKITLNNFFANVASNVAIKGGTLSVLANSTVNGAITINGIFTVTGNTAINGNTSIANATITLGNANNFTVANLNVTRTSTSNLTVNSHAKFCGDRITFGPATVTTGNMFSTNAFLYVDSSNTIQSANGFTIRGDVSAILQQGTVAGHSVYASDLFDKIFLINFPNIRLCALDNVAGYSQTLMQNSNTSANASSDFVVTADIGTDISNYGDYGIASSMYAYPGFEIIKPLDVYLFSSDSDLLLGSTGSNTGVVIFTGGGDANATHSQFHGNGMFEVRGTTQTDKLYFSNTTNAPANAASAGVKGEVRIDADYIYVCTATNTWKRSDISTWS